MSRPIAEHEIQRILALVPWILEHPDTRKTDIAEHFGIPLEQLEEDLRLMILIGVPPYSPAEYVWVEEDDDGRVHIELADFFRRPLRLTPAEGLAVLAAGRTLLAVRGSDPDGALATALEKLERATDAAVTVGMRAPAALEEVRQAVADREQVEIVYWSGASDEQTTRTVEPGAVFFSDGAWYLDAYCTAREAPRIFRVDRIREVHPTGRRFEPRSDMPARAPEEVYRPGPNDTAVTMELPPAAAWVTESYPTESVEERADGSLRVVLRVSSEVWLARLLLRVGPSARVIDPPELTRAGARAAARVLARYETP